MEALKQLLSNCQVAVVSGMSGKRFARVLDHLEQIGGVTFDAAYRDVRPDWCEFQDYSQIARDFCCEDPAQILVVGSLDVEPSLRDSSDAIPALYDAASHSWVRYCSLFLIAFRSKSLPFSPSGSHKQPVTLLVPHLRWSRVGLDKALQPLFCATAPALKQASSSTCALPVIPHSGKPKSHHTRAGPKNGVGNSSLTMGGTNWEAAFAALVRRKPSGILAFQTDAIGLHLKQEHIRQESLLKHHIETAKKRRPTVPKPAPNPAAAQLVPESTQSALKAELFVEFKRANVALYDCLRVAAHNALLIKSSFAEVSEAAAGETATPGWLLDTEKYLEYYKDIAGREPGVGKIVMFLRSGTTTAEEEEEEDFSSEPLIFPYLNVSTFTQTQTQKRRGLGSKKNSYDPDMDTVEGPKHGRRAGKCS